MTTKEKILETALKLFNERGTDQITTRHIAAEMKISHGNLCYHYPKKEEIIKKLYEELVQELDNEISKVQLNVVSISLLIQMAEITFGIQLKYKFFLIEIVKIMRDIPEIKTHFRSLYQKREAQFTFIIEKLISESLFNASLFEGNYEKIIKQFYLIGDFWISEAEILFEGSPEEKLRTYVEIATAFFTPYLTQKGRAQLTG
ncbi:MAG TPA: TetR/AcrR family transcriptional regulator [Cytophagales bacterium]|nr:TetR/AcrR family transcriptional regulator [Cytophagales bacterium]